MELVNLSNAAGVIILDSILNADSEELINKSINEAALKGLNKVILDFRPVDHMNSLGVSNLVKLVAIAKKKNIYLFAHGLSKRYRELFAIASLDKEITVIDGEGVTGLLAPDEVDSLKKLEVKEGKQSDAGWAPYIERISVTERPEGAMIKNMDNHRLQPQISGFG
ncbi:MAG: STAS domain-containing protein, partial [Peptococcaceae bacterium]